MMKIYLFFKKKVCVFVTQEVFIIIKIIESW